MESFLVLAIELLSNTLISIKNVTWMTITLLFLPIKNKFTISWRDLPNIDNNIDINKYIELYHGAIKSIVHKNQMPPK